MSSSDVIPAPDEAPSPTGRAAVCSSGTVLHLIETGGPGGAETVMARLIDGLASSGWQSIAVVPWAGWLLEALREAGVETHVVRSAGSFDWRWLLKVGRLARRKRADLIQTHLFGAGVYGSALGRLARLPVIATIHGEVDIPRHDRGMAIKAALLRGRGTRLVAVSSSIKQKLCDDLGLPEERVQLIENGIDVDSFATAQRADLRREMGWAPDDVVIGAVGNVRRPKDYANLLEAAAILCDQHPTLRFAIVGDTEEEPDLFADLLQRRERLQLNDRVAFLGFQKNIPGILKDIDVYVMSSSREGLPLALLQAMASGRPIVATRCGGPQEVLTNGKNGMLVPSGEPAALADAISTVVEDGRLAGDLGRRAQEVVSRLYGLRTMIEGYERLYQKALTRSG